MSREGAPSNQPKAAPAAGTPIWVWLVYAVGIFAAILITVMVLFNIGVLYLSDEGDEYEWNLTWVLAAWCVPVVVAALLWISRRPR